MGWVLETHCRAFAFTPANTFAERLAAAGGGGPGAAATKSKQFAGALGLTVETGAPAGGGTSSGSNLASVARLSRRRGAVNIEEFAAQMVAGTSYVDSRGGSSSSLAGSRRSPSSTRGLTAEQIFDAGAMALASSGNGPDAGTAAMVSSSNSRASHRRERSTSAPLGVGGTSGPEGAAAAGPKPRARARSGMLTPLVRQKSLSDIAETNIVHRSRRSATVVA